MPPREDLILFLDLETTGTNEEKDNIIEIGLSMIDATKAPEYPELDAINLIVKPTDDALRRLIDKDVVFEMHQKSGLYDYLRNPELAHHVNSLEDAEFKAIAFLDRFVAGDTSHIPLGGSGVLHFDRKFIKRWLPKFDKRLTYWAYDMGVFRRSFQKAGVAPYSQEAKTHRALDDARVHADEFRFYQKFISG